MDEARIFQEGKARAVGINLTQGTGSEYYFTVMRHVDVTKITFFHWLYIFLFTEIFHSLSFRVSRSNGYIGRNPRLPCFTKREGSLRVNLVYGVNSKNWH